MEDEIVTLIFGILVGFLIGAVIMFCTFSSGKMTFKDEVIDDVCKQLTGNETAIAEEDDLREIQRKLICVIPSFDDTQNIIIKTNDGG